MAYPLPSPVHHVEEEVPPALLALRDADRRRQIRVLHHPLPQHRVPSPVALVPFHHVSYTFRKNEGEKPNAQLARRYFLHDVPRVLVEDGEQRLGREAVHLGVQLRHVRDRVCGR